MDTEEIKNKKENLQYEIAGMIDQFEKATGVVVSAIDLTSVSKEVSLMNTKTEGLQNSVIIEVKL
jgi:hypothetical protein